MIIFIENQKNIYFSYVIKWTQKIELMNDLEALAVDDRWAGLVVLLLADPHLLEGGERGQDGSSDPDGVFALWRGDDLDLHGGRRQGGDFLLHAVGDAREHGGASRHDGVGVQVLADVHVALHDGVVGGLVDAARLHADERWLEHRLWATEALVSDGDDLTVGEFVGLLQGARRGGGGHLLFEVEGDIAELLLDVADDFALGSGGESVTAFGQDLHQEVGQVTAGQIETEDGMRQGITLVDWDGVRDAITRVHDDTGGASRGVERENGLDGDVHGGCVEGLEHDLSHLLSVGFGVQWSLGQQDWVLFWGNAQFIVEGVVPDLLHVVPVGDDSVLDRVFQGENTALALGLVSNIGVLLSHADHDALVTGTSNDRWKDGTWCVITGETGLAHARSVVNDECGNFFFAHFASKNRQSRKIN